MKSDGPDRLATMGASYRSGHASGFVEGAAWALAHLRRLARVPDGKPMAGERSLVVEAIRRWGEAAVIEAWRARGLDPRT